MPDRTETKISLFSSVHLIYKTGTPSYNIPIFLRVITHAGFIRISHWTGVSIFINSLRPGRDNGANNFAEKDISSVILQLSEKFCKSEREIRVKTWDTADELFLELLQAAKEENWIMARVKTLELLMKLKNIPMDEALILPAFSECTPREAIVAKSIYSYIMRHMEKHVTIRSLSEIFHISQTQIKLSFKKYFGQAVFTYMRREKMNAAAYMLRNTKSSIQDIARSCGYSNAGKFTKAFTREMNITPREYRKNI